MNIPGISLEEEDFELENLHKNDTNFNVNMKKEKENSRKRRKIDVWDHIIHCVMEDFPGSHTILW